MMPDQEIAGRLLLLERRAAKVGAFHREFIVDCPHATTSVIMSNWPVVDIARGSGVYGRLIEQHRRTVADKEGEACDCRPEMTRASS
jgi:hypothetical protein